MLCILRFCVFLGCSSQRSLFIQIKDCPVGPVIASNAVEIPLRHFRYRVPTLRIQLFQSRYGDLHQIPVHAVGLAAAIRMLETNRILRSEQRQSCRQASDENHKMDQAASLH